MASFRQRNNKWQARVSRDRYPDRVKTFNARSDAENLPHGGKPCAASMVLLLALRLNKADNVELMQKPFTAMKRAKREPNALRVCVGFEN
jgi:hypothetical protein